MFKLNVRKVIVAKIHCEYFSNSLFVICTKYLELVASLSEALCHAPPHLEITNTKNLRQI